MAEERTLRIQIALLLAGAIPFLWSVIALVRLLVGQG